MTNTKIKISIDDSLNVLMQKSEHADRRMVSRLHERKFTAADTGLTYRQINYLTSSDVMTDTRDSDSGWRRFDLKELIYLSIVKDLRDLGIKDSILKTVHRAFFERSRSRMSDIIIFTALAGEKVLLAINPDGSIGFYSIQMHHIAHTRANTQIVVNISEYVVDLWNRHIGDHRSYRDEFDYIQALIERDGTTAKERRLLNIILDRKFKEIRVKKKDGEKMIIDADEITPAEGRDLASLITEKDFGEITVTVKDGNPMHLVNTTKFKI